MTFFIARRDQTNPHLPDRRDIATVVDEPLSDALAQANHRSGVPRLYRVWHVMQDAWFELTGLDFRPAGGERWEAVHGPLRFAVEKRGDGWHALGWQPNGMGWHPRPFPIRAAAEAWCTDTYGAHETGGETSARAAPIHAAPHAAP